MAMRFPLTDLLDEQESYNFLLKTLHPDGLKCRCGHPLPPDQKPHNRKRDPIFKYRCRICGRVFNLFTDTVWQGSQYDCRKIVLVRRGIAQGTPTLQLADELEVDYGTLLERWHQIQRLGLEHKLASAMSDEETEADEMFQNAGEKGTKHSDPHDPPRRRANKRRGKGTMANDRPPVLGVVGRESGQIRLKVCDDAPKTPFSLKSKKRPNRPRLCARMKVTPIIGSPALVGDTARSVILKENRRGTTMAMVSVKSIATPWKASGPDCVPFGAFTKSIWPSM